VLLVTGRLEFWHLVATAMVIGAIFPFTMPARTAVVVNIIGKRGLQNAMALSMGGMNATRILGPTLSGFMVPVLGVAGAFSIGIVLYAIALLCLLGVHRCPPPEDARDRSVLEDLGDGFRYVGGNRLVLVLLAFGILPMFLAMPFQTLLVVFTEEVWQVGTRGLGILSAVSGLGGLLGSVYVAQLSEMRGRLDLMLGSLVAFASFLLAFAMSPWFLLGLPLVLIANVFSSVFGTLNNAAIQLLIPDRVRGRVSSFLMMSFGLTPLGTLPMAAVAERFGAPVAVAGASLLVIAVGLVFFASSASLRSVDARTRDALEAE
jgi:predicted MFS family arabinose efflux permease